MSKKLSVVENKKVSEAVSTAVVIQSLEKKAKPVFKKLESIDSITTVEDNERAAEQLKFLKVLAQEADAQQKEITDPLEQAKKATIKLFKPFKDRVAEMETTIKLKMSNFLTLQKKKEVKLLEDFDNGKIKNVSTFTKKSQELQITSNVMQVRKVWTVEVENENEIPREYLVPDMEKIKQAFKDGKKVKGAKYFQKETIAI
jgi:hypothetical protein